MQRIGHHGLITFLKKLALSYVKFAERLGHRSLRTVDVCTLRCTNETRQGSRSGLRYKLYNALDVIIILLVIIILYYTRLLCKRRIGTRARATQSRRRE